MTETHELVVPKSIPMTSAAAGLELHRHRTSVSIPNKQGADGYGQHTVDGLHKQYCGLPESAGHGSEPGEQGRRRVMMIVGPGSLTRLHSGTQKHIRSTSQHE